MQTRKEAFQKPSTNCTNFTNLKRNRCKRNAAGETLRTQTSTWTQDDTGVTYIVNPRITSQTTTLDKGLSTRVDTTYTTNGTVMYAKSSRMASAARPYS